MDPIDVGLYKVTAQGFYTGMGQLELKEGYFTVEVKDTVPERIIIKKMSENGVGIQVRPEDGYGSKGFDIQLLDKDERIVSFKGDDLDVSLKQGGRLIDSKNSERVWWESKALTTSAHLSSHLYPKSFREQYELTATHRPTGLTATHSFTDIGSWEASDKQPLNLPSEEPPTVNTSVHPTCLAYAKAPTGLEFAGGSGTDTDPLVICNETQLRSYRNPRGSRYCQSTRRCSGMPNPERPSRSLYVALLGDSIDFKGAMIAPIEFYGLGPETHRLDGGMRSISNYVIVDSELERQGLFRDYSNLYDLEIRNLIVSNPVVRGDRQVAALYAGYSPIKLVNVAVIGGAVWGKDRVGGAVVYGRDLENVRVFGTEVRYEWYCAGGLAWQLQGGSSLVFTGSIAPAGVPGITERVGGIAGEMSGRVTNVLMTGNVITLNSSRSNMGVGGIAGVIGGIPGVNDKSTLINAVMRGNVVSTGAGVGGIVGMLNGGSFGLDPLKPYAPVNQDIVRYSAIIGARVEGNIWGGMSRKGLECIDEVAQILGVGGGTDCIGDIKSQNGGRSDVGGIAGTNRGGLIQDSVFAGTVRGVSAVGGIVGYDSGVSNYVRNTSQGVVSASEGVSEYGALIGLSESLRARDKSFKGRVVSRFDSNTIVPGEGNPAWAIGKLDNEIASTMTSNVPDYYDR